MLDFRDQILVSISTIYQRSRMAESEFWCGIGLTERYRGCCGAGKSAEHVSVLWDEEECEASAGECAVPRRERYYELTEGSM